jgi:hypothetical protein
MNIGSDKGSMGADRVLKVRYSVPADAEVREAVQFEPFALLGRKLSTREKIKKGIFLFSTAAAVGYYVFLLVLFLIR